MTEPSVVSPFHCMHGQTVDRVNIVCSQWAVIPVATGKIDIDTRKSCMHSWQMHHVHAQKCLTKAVIVVANLLIPGEVGNVGSLPCPVHIDPISFETVNA